jgi:hypothetical protein
MQQPASMNNALVTYVRWPDLATYTGKNEHSQYYRVPIIN